MTSVAERPVAGGRPQEQRILLVEDDVSIANPLSKGLRRAGYQVDWVRNGKEALAGPAGDVVLLDLGLPDLDGLEVCRRLRAESDVPILVVTARGTEMDRVVGLEIGADDYIVKPFGFRELVARIGAVTRRRTKPTAAVPTDIETARLHLEPSSRRAWVDGVEIELSKKEFDLLCFLAAEPGILHSRDAILTAVWDEHWYGPSKTLDVHIAALRKKLNDASLIENVRGVGYRFKEDG